MKKKVYAALNTSQDVVAVKTKKPVKNKKFTDIANTLFRSEIEVLCQLRHPNIVKFMGAEFGGGAGAKPKSIVMEYIQGDCLDLVLKETNGINESLIKVYTYQVLNAIVFMHSKNIMHRYVTFQYIKKIFQPTVIYYLRRDLKSSNIMIVRTYIVKIIDFGMGKAVHSIYAPQTDSMNSVVGTIPYMVSKEGFNFLTLMFRVINFCF
jgi:serine/threonine protein kinase